MHVIARLALQSPTRHGAGVLVKRMRSRADEGRARAAEQNQARCKTAAHIRRSGAIGNLAQGPEILAHGLSTRLIAWPGTGYQTESVHVVTLRPGQESQTYTYQLAEDAFLCHKGRPMCPKFSTITLWTTIDPMGVFVWPGASVSSTRVPSKSPVEDSGRPWGGVPPDLRPSTRRPLMQVKARYASEAQ